MNHKFRCDMSGGVRMVREIFKRGQNFFEPFRYPAIRRSKNGVPSRFSNPGTVSKPGFIDAETGQKQRKVPNVRLRVSTAEAECVKFEEFPRKVCARNA